MGRALAAFTLRSKFGLQPPFSDTKAKLVIDFVHTTGHQRTR